MGEFEFRILNPDGTLLLTHVECHLNDVRAINAARRIAKGAHFEVWQGEVKIFPAASAPLDPLIGF